MQARQKFPKSEKNRQKTQKTQKTWSSFVAHLPAVSLVELLSFASAQLQPSCLSCVNSCRYSGMSRVVQKFGGSSLADLACMRRAAQLVAQRWHEGWQVVVVVSAMGGRTDDLLALASEASKAHAPASAETDALLATGEQESAALMTLCLHHIGLKARSYTGWQIPVETCGAHGNARVQQIATANVLATLQEKAIAVCTGFQGTTSNGERITTLGRGGSDTSAVLLAAALEAERCEIFTDVEGVYTTDPRIVTTARKIATIDYEEMLEMAALGARVLETRAASAAMRFRVPLLIRSTFSESPGTSVSATDKTMEQRSVTALAYSDKDAKIALVGLDNTPGIAAKVFAQLALNNISVDMIVQGTTQDEKKAHITFTVAKTDLENACVALEEIRTDAPFQELRCDDKVIKISLIGAGMNSYAGVASRMFRTLADKGINIQIIATSEIKISVLIAADYLELAVRSLHAVFELQKETSSPLSSPLSSPPSSSPSSPPSLSKSTAR